MKDTYGYTKEQEECEIEEHVKELLPQELQEEYALARRYPAEEPEGRVPQTSERRNHWRQTALRIARNFITSYQDLLEEQEATRESMSSSEGISVIVATAVKTALESKTTSRIRAKLPETYNGERKTSVLDNWLFAVERYQDAENLTDVDTVKLAVT
jgi:hypothetical protein